MKAESFGSNYGQPHGKDGVNQLKVISGKKTQLQFVNSILHKSN